MKNLLKAGNNVHNYYYRDKAGQEIGPLDLVTLSKFRMAGVLDGDTPVRAADSAEWKLCREVIADSPQSPTALTAKKVVKKTSNGMLIALFAIVVVVIIATRSSNQHTTKGSGSEVFGTSVRVLVAENGVLREPSPLEMEAGKAAKDFWKITKLGNSYYLCEDIATSIMPNRWSEPAKTLFELRRPQVEVVTDSLSEADKLNGIEWRGSVELHVDALRSYNPNVSQALWHRQPDETWTEWRVDMSGGSDLSETLYNTLVGQRKNGKCALRLGGSTGVMLFGNSPSSSDRVIFEQVEPSALPGDQGAGEASSVAVDAFNKEAMQKQLQPTALQNSAEDARIECANNLKQIGLAFKMWAGDNGGYQYPFNVKIASGGTMEYCDRTWDGSDKNSFLHFQVLSNYISSTKLLICPSDTKKPAIDFAHLQSANVSYQLHSGDNVNESKPREILAYCPIHHNVVYVDGSVAQLSTQQISESKAISAANACINNLRQIDGAISEWALETRKQNGAVPTWNDVKQYIKLDANGAVPGCPAGGIYTLHPVGSNPQVSCSIPGHVLP